MTEQKIIVNSQNPVNDWKTMRKNIKFTEVNTYYRSVCVGGGVELNGFHRNRYD